MTTLAATPANAVRFSLAAITRQACATCGDETMLVAMACVHCGRVHGEPKAKRARSLKDGPRRVPLDPALEAKRKKHRELIRRYRALKKAEA